MKRPLLRMILGLFSALALMAAFFAVSTVLSPLITDRALWQYVSGLHRLLTAFAGIFIFRLLFGKERLSEAFSLKGFGRGFLAAFPIILFSSLCFALTFIGLKRFVIDDMAYFIGDVFFITAATALFEEVVLRGLLMEEYFLLKHQSRFTRFVFAFLSAAVFTACHTQYYSAPVSLLRIFALGFSFAAAFMYSRNLLVCTAVHILYDVAVCMMKYSENISSTLSVGLYISLDFVRLSMFAVGLVFILLKKPCPESESV